MVTLLRYGHLAGRLRPCGSGWRNACCCSPASLRLQKTGLPSATGISPPGSPLEFDAAALVPHCAAEPQMSPFRLWELGMSPVGPRQHWAAWEGGNLSWAPRGHEKCQNPASLCRVLQSDGVAPAVRAGRQACLLSSPLATTTKPRFGLTREHGEARPCRDNSEPPSCVGSPPTSRGFVVAHRVRTCSFFPPERRRIQPV